MKWGVITEPILMLNVVSANGHPSIAQPAIMGVHQPFGRTGRTGSVHNIGQIVFHQSDLRGRLAGHDLNIPPADLSEWQVALTRQTDYAIQRHVILGERPQVGPFALLADQMANLAILQHKCQT